jgi:U3 small nucleolar RNA-associated protein 3
MSREDKLALLEKDSPELFDLLEDFDFNMSETVELLQFQSRVAKDSPTFTDEGREYLDCKLHLDLLYCMNIMFYLYLKASGLPVKSHPVIQRIVQIKKMIGQLEPLASEMQGQIEALLSSLNSETPEENPAMDQYSAVEDGVSKKPRKRKQGVREMEIETEIKSMKKKSAKISGANVQSGLVEEDPLDYYDRVLEEKKRKREQRMERRRKEEAEGEKEADLDEGEDGKRAVTYQV